MESLDDLQKEALSRLRRVSTLHELDELEIDIFGRKQGKLTKVLRSLAGLTEEKKRKLGREANALKKELVASFDAKKQELVLREMPAQLEKEKVDVTFPGKKREKGHLHPLTLVRLEAEKIFTSLGFSVVEGPEVETEFYNFDALNIPPSHPAREMHDTFWIKSAAKRKASKYLLRTHTSPVQLRYMEKHNPPFRIVVPGKVFRHEATDASHDLEFMQLEGLMVGKDVSVANLEYVLQLFFERIFRSIVSIRLRPSYFPFVEPGFEVDMSCLACRGKGCTVCKYSGWLELLGAGMIHQNVFETGGYVRGEWQGFAFGIGLDRIAMMKYKIPDIRLFRENNVRFLEQF